MSYSKSCTIVENDIPLKKTMSKMFDRIELIDSEMLTRRRHHGVEERSSRQGDGFV